MRIFIYLIIFFAFFDLFAQLPIMSPFAVDLGATPFLAGLAVGMYSLSNVAGNVISGIFADRRGPFTVLIFGLVSTGVVLFSYHLADGPYSLLAIRFFHGLAAGFAVPAAFTFLANRTKQNRRGKGAAVSGAFVGLAAIVGPAFGAIYASRTSVPEMMGITGTILLLLGAISYFLLKKEAPKKESVQAPKAPFMESVRTLGLFQAFAGAFFLMFSQGVLAYMLPLKVEALQLPAEMSGLLLSTFGIAAILVFLLPVNRLFDRIQPVYTLIAGFSCMALSLFLLSTVSLALFMYIVMASYGIGFALLFPSINSLLIDSTTLQSRGRAYGYFYAFFSFGVVAGSSVTGALELSANEGFILSGSLLLLIAAFNGLAAGR
ncbi:MFS transporter [Planococcus ruber]|uniref:MFS transporter n=1 Tax=Planococcus ruber TaxID=2027871 RepID=UPI001FEDEFF8|nr:MFS transporter [Planococcus ruber]MCJ1909444.1 MFS transporter [Planococcus ruber]